jgi:ParB-like chromosome segregation protein Spo0J|tara:strand:+ start:3625 stop:4281 length:657 start_codon:yes stop_codon:yes gene_type:complete
MKDSLKKTLVKELSTENKIELIEEIKELLHSESPLKDQPVNRIRWVKIEEVSPNDYNPNSVAKKEMGLLYTSIKHDGYTQPIVTIQDQDTGMYVIIDGFHRYYTAKTNVDILERNKGYLPIVVLEKDINDRMASTVRHNRARGMHSIAGMSSMVFSMLENGWSDKDICNELGMGVEELVKLKHITGFSKLFEDAEYNKAWESANQIRLKIKYKEDERK